MDVQYLGNLSLFNTSLQKTDLFQMNIKFVFQKDQKKLSLICMLFLDSIDLISMIWYKYWS